MPHNTDIGCVGCKFAGTGSKACIFCPKDEGRPMWTSPVSPNRPTHVQVVSQPTAR